MRKNISYALSAMALAFLAMAASAQPPDAGPAKVVVATGRVEVVAPEAEYTGTIFYHKISEVATEIRGKVKSVGMEVGDRVQKGQALVSIDTVLLEKDMKAARARIDQTRSNLEDAQTRFERADKLSREGLTPQEQYDTFRFEVNALEHQLAALEAEYERLEALLSKTTIHAPFDGVVLQRPVDIGEWLGEGDPVAIVAGQGSYDLIVDAPQSDVRVVQPGNTITVVAENMELTGRVVTVVPRGDIATRTIPVKIRIEHDQPLYEGMAARARLPIGAPIECVMVPRDALLNELGRNSVYTVEDGVARRHYVDIVAYRGSWVGVGSEFLDPTDTYIVKGHERLRDGASVAIVPGSDLQDGVTAAD